MKFKLILNKLWNILYPENYSCIFCDNEVIKNEYSACDDCIDKFKINTKVCQVCGIPLSSMATVCLRCKNKNHHIFKQARTPFIYKDEVAYAIQKLKYDNGKYLAKPLAKFMADCYKQYEFNCDCIIPVPLHKDKQKLRGYNQSQLLADALSGYINLEVFDNVLLREKDTLTQTNLNYMQRQENLKDAFKVENKNLIMGKNVLLIDDVFTTGATSENCANSLIKAGAKRVDVLCVAHTFIEDKNIVVNR